MHIAFNGWFWDQPNTGSGQYIRRLLHHLRRIAPDLDMTLILPPHNKAADDLPKDVNLAVTNGPGGKLGKVWFEQRIFPKMVERVQADIAHAPYWGPPLSSPAKLVTSALDVASLIIPNYTQGLTGRVYNALIKTAASGSAYTITLSDATKAEIVQHLKLPEDKIAATYLAADDIYHPKMGADKDDSVRQKYNLPENFVLYLGGFDLRKQVNQLMLAYTYVIQAEGDYAPLVLAGKEPEWGTSVFPNLRDYAKNLDIEDYIIWTGYIDEADKPSLYRLADIFVYPSMYEGFGLPVIEAMACGTPVIANKIPVMEEIVGDGAFLTATVREMAGAMIALLTQKPLRDTMINQGIAQATRYSWRKTAQQTLEVYEKVMRL
jgi:glycosyltransferase involved in cell wall biosynthesis